jgi:hypothetical protein
MRNIVDASTVCRVMRTICIERQAAIALATQSRRQWHPAPEQKTYAAVPAMKKLESQRSATESTTQSGR